MPLLEIAQNRRYLSAMIRVEETTAQRIDQYAAFMNTTADEVVDKALAYVFARDKEFQEWVQKPEAARIRPSLRIRRLGHNGATTEPMDDAPKHRNSPAAVGGARAQKAPAGME